MPWLRPRRRLLLIAFALSLLLHVFGLTGDTLLLLAEPRHQAPDTPLRKPSRQLAQTDISGLLPPPELAGITPVDTLQLALGQPEVRPEPDATPQPTQAVSPPPTPVSTPRPSAMPVMPLPTSTVASAVSVAPVPTITVPPTTLPSPAPSPLPSSAGTHGFPRSVEIVYYWGPVPARLTWHVERGQYQVKLRGAVPGNRREMTSRGEITAKGIRPLEFTDLRNGQLRSQAVFDWASATATLNDRGNLRTEPLAPGDQDLFSAAFHLALRSLSDSTFALFNGRKRYPDVHFTVAGESTLRIGNEDVDVLLLRGRYEDRQFDFWLAPKWHNLPVRMQAKLGKDGSSYDIWAGSMTIEGEQVLRPASDDHQRRR